MKKTVAYVLLLIFLLTACGGNGEAAVSPGRPAVTTDTVQVTQEPTPEETLVAVPITTELVAEEPMEEAVAGEPVMEEVVAEEPVAEEPEGTTYTLNNNTKKFHYPSCGSAKKIKEKNRASCTGTRDELIERGYSPCGNCHP